MLPGRAWAALIWIQHRVAIANETVRATTFYSLKDDGLKQPWSGKVWLNPPFGRFWPKFVARCVKEFRAGRVEQAVILLKAVHKPTAAFQDTMTVEHLVCEPRKRINFYSNSFKVSTTPQGGTAVLIGIGIQYERFEAHFGKLGKIAFVEGPA